MKTARRDQVEGTVDKAGGRMHEAMGRLTGRRSHVFKGKAIRARGAARQHKGHIKRPRRHRGGVLGGLLRTVGGLLAGVTGLVTGLLQGVFRLLRRLV
jgi:uncharacterized protein YjbJ (UPF0337 family)